MYLCRSSQYGVNPYLSHLRMLCQFITLFQNHEAHQTELVLIQIGKQMGFLLCLYMMQDRSIENVGEVKQSKI